MSSKLGDAWHSPKAQRVRDMFPAMNRVDIAATLGVSYATVSNYLQTEEEFCRRHRGIVERASGRLRDGSQPRRKRLNWREEAEAVDPPHPGTPAFIEHRTIDAVLTGLPELDRSALWARLPEAERQRLRGSL